ncbi:bifunctional phosphoribosyl-AMP cyclohydrolase/phosphoribosyl-ATP diphosphatase HisIE [Numidum massiliense]|uniref:bifunctional phosphoribosyl-AMP cyclohydrolase/phosphoribosyl-ATP diphosphatase HisIE n=1 Tax=Numidum massiliense TaxID=1522315 RepID=UPI0006D54F3B|nr:bifunctional phosphoribosyl-AMP cyclohydrolase/phosphoribosyl-ATP diphosphatase HisIE [Numidum massiliense]
MLTAARLPARLRFDSNGLVPAIIQDAATKEVLTLAYMNETALTHTVETGEVWLWSRSRQQLWHKGETSGNTQRVVAISFDCDDDALLVQVVPRGPACHTGTVSCFREAAYRDSEERTDAPTGATNEEQPISTKAASDDLLRVLRELEVVVAAREKERPQGAYTTYLFTEGLDKILKKVGEEASEVIIAAKNRSASELRAEAADLLYHLLVLLREQRLPLASVLEELQSRQLQSE